MHLTSHFTMHALSAQTTLARPAFARVAKVHQVHIQKSLSGRGNGRAWGVLVQRELPLAISTRDPRKH